MKQTFTIKLKKGYSLFLFILSTVLLSFTAVAQNPLSASLGFNIFAETYVSMKGGVVDGAIASGGNFTVNGGSQYNANGVLFGANPYISIGGNNYALVVDGAFIATSGYFNINGLRNNWVKIGNLNGAVSGTSNFNQLRITNGNTYIQVNSTNQTFSQVAGNGLVNFPAAFASLRASSLGLAACPNNVSASYLLGNPTVTLSGTKNIWNITGAQLNSWSSIAFSILTPPSAARPLVINVDAAGTYNLNMPLLLGMSGLNAPYIILNFYNATAINYSNGNTIVGSILAPNAKFDKTGSQIIQGQVICSSYLQSAGTVQVSPFNANVASCIICPTTTSAGANISQCNSNAFTLAANAAPTGTTGTWTVVSGAATIASPNSPISSATVTTSPATLRWTVSVAGCTGISADVVLTNTVVSTSNAGAAQSKCGNNIFTMAANAAATGETGTWSVVSGAAAITNVNSATTNITVTTSPAILSWTIAKGNCTSVSNVVLTNTTSTIANAGPAQSKCSNNTFTMAANAAATGETGTWAVVSGAATITSINSATTNVTVTTSPATLSWTIVKGNCSTSSTITLTNTTITTSNAGPAQSKCSNNTFTMAANAAATGETGTWSVVNGAATITNANSATTAVTVTTSPATLSWTIAKGSCTSSSNVVLTNTTITIAKAGAAQSKCSNPVFTMGANTPAADETGTWSVVSGAATITNVNSTATNVTVTASPATLSWTITKGNCSTSANVILTNTNITTANAGADQTGICGGKGKFVMAATAAGTNEAGTWTIVSGAATIVDANLPTTNVSVITSPAVLLWTIKNGSCASSSTVTLTANAAYTIVVLGSSTAYGSGATPIDSSWVNKFTGYIKAKNLSSQVINLGVPGYTTYHVLCPTNFISPANRPAPDTLNNITAALKYHPDAIIINLPSNDVANNYSIAEQQANYERTMALANAANIAVWVATTQPRNDLSSIQIDSLQRMRDWTYTRFGANAVDFWTTLAAANGTIDPAYNYDGIHVNNAGHDIFYKRMVAESITDSLCYRRYNKIPIAKAGNDTLLLLPASSFLLDGTASTDLDGTIAAYQWVKISGQQNAQIVNPAGASTTVNNLVEGIYSFELSVTDNNGAVKKDTIIVTVGSRVLIDAGVSSSITASPDNGGKYWNNLTSGVPGVQVSNAVTTTNLPTAITLEVVNRIDGTFDPIYNGVNPGNTTGAVNDYPVSATVDFAFADPSATNGQWKFSGLDANRQYTFKFWGTKSADNRFIQIKRADETNWQEYDAGYNTDYNRAAYFTFTGKTEMAFDIRVKAGSTFGYISVIDISSTSLFVPSNILPIAKAGNDTLVSIPSNSVVLNGNASSDLDGTIAAYQWTKIAGPSGTQLINAPTAAATVNNLTEGIYSFELRVTDNNGGVGKDTITVTVGNRILIDAGNTATNSPDDAGKYWNNITTGVPGVQITNAVTTTNTATTLSLEVVNRIDGTYNPIYNGVNSGNTTGAVGDYPATATVDFAFAEPSATNGQWKFAGLDAAKQYTFKFWGTKSAASRFIQIKRADDTNWQEYDAGFNTDYNRAAYFTFSGKTEMAFDIRVKDGSSFGYISVIDISSVTLSTTATNRSNRIANNKIVPKTDEANEQVSATLYPNPSNGNFTIAVPVATKNNPVSIDIVNSFGQSVYHTASASNGNITINMAGKLASGVYIIKIRKNGIETIRRAVIKRD